MRAVFAKRVRLCVMAAAPAAASILSIWPALGSDQVALSLDTLSATRDKPLFSPTRQRPPPVSAVVATPKPDETSIAESTTRYELVGIIAGADAVTILLRDPKKDELIKIRSGDHIGDWQVLAMSNYSVRLQNGERNVDIRIFSE